MSRRTIADIRAAKGAVPLVCLTASSEPFARLLDPFCDLILVGDSLAMTLYGHKSTLGLDLETMIRHGRAVVGATARALVTVDLPFGSYQEGKEQAMRSAAAVLARTGCDAVKLEGGQVMAETIDFLSHRGVPVVGHIGLQPQSVNTLGGYAARGREEQEAQAILEDGAAVAAAGAFALVIEGVLEPLARRITEQVTIPTIGIGASLACDGQILVAEDMLGLTAGKRPRFVRAYADLSAAIETAASVYADDVRARRFPGSGELYGARSKT